jgi:hypothetical protein
MALAWRYLMHRLRIGLLLFLAGFALFVARPPAAEAQTAACFYTLGFQALHNMIPQVAGSCLENEWHNPYNGDGLQRTTGGLMVWRKSDNWTAFTNGYMTWINGPLGLQSRLNTERFAWEGSLPPPAIPEANQPGAGGSAGGGTTAPAPTPTPIPTPTRNPAPSLDLRVSDDRVTAGEEFTIRLQSEDDSGVEVMWWWATNTGDQALRDTHAFDCGGATPCRQTWSVSTEDLGEMTIHARARGRDGQVSDEKTEELRVRVANTPTPTPTPNS